MQCWLNGRLCNINEAHVSLLSHSFGRGTAIFEVLEIVTNNRGTALLAIHQHLERFTNSAHAIYLNLPYSNEEIVSGIISCAKANNVTNGLVKFFAYYDDMELSILPLNANISCAIFCMDYQNLPFTREQLLKPARACISSYKKLDASTVPVHAKVAGNYVNGYLAQMEATRKGFTDEILIDTKGNIAEAATANIFFVMGDSIHTPTLQSIMPGITRMIILDMLRYEKFNYEECDIHVNDMKQYTEAFFSGSIDNILPIASIDDIAFTPAPGTMTAQIQQLLTALLNDEHALSQKYLYYF
jgi:branched-chain amino acid aminotransferase